MQCTCHVEKPIVLPIIITAISFGFPTKDLVILCTDNESFKYLHERVHCVAKAMHFRVGVTQENLVLPSKRFNNESLQIPAWTSSCLIRQCHSSFTRVIITLNFYHFTLYLYIIGAPYMRTFLFLIRYEDHLLKFVNVVKSFAAYICLLYVLHDSILYSCSLLPFLNQQLILLTFRLACKHLDSCRK